MATKKKTEVTEEIKEAEATEQVVEEAPKKTTKKSSKKKVEESPVEEIPVEEPSVEEVKPEPEVEVVGKKVVEITTEPAAKEEPKTESSYQIQVVSPSGIFTFKKPGLDQQKGKVYVKGTKLIVSEVKGNWAKVGEDKWIILSGAVAKI